MDGLCECLEEPWRTATGGLHDGIFFLPDGASDEASELDGQWVEVGAIVVDRLDDARTGTLGCLCEETRS